MKYSTCRCVCTWLAMAIGAVIFLAAGPAAAYMPEPMRMAKPGRYRQFRQKLLGYRYQIRRIGHLPTILKEAGSMPPKPLQVFEYGPSRLTYLANPKKYKYQYVCVIARTGHVNEATWHRRRAPRNWTRIPPYYIRIVRPNPAGFLDYMLTAKKIKLVKRDVTIKATSRTTGKTEEVTRRLTVVERNMDNLPRRLKRELAREAKGKVARPRKTKGKWGPSNSEKSKQKAVDKLLSVVGLKDVGVGLYEDEEGNVIEDPRRPTRMEIIAAQKWAEEEAKKKGFWSKMTMKKDKKLQD